MAQEQEWQNTQESDLQEIQHAVHRTLLSRQSIYHMVLYPNREVDIQRDQVFSDHIAAISARITPQHAKLQIPSKYCRECPWPSAQEEAKLISVYRTPQEKMTQTARLCKVIFSGFFGKELKKRNKLCKKVLPLKKIFFCIFFRFFCTTNITERRISIFPVRDAFFLFWSKTLFLFIYLST